MWSKVPLCNTIKKCRTGKSLSKSLCFLKAQPRISVEQAINKSWLDGFTLRFPESSTCPLHLDGIYGHICAEFNLCDLADNYYKLPPKFIHHVLSSNFKWGAKYTDSFQAKSRDSCVTVGAASTTGEVVAPYRQKPCCCCHLLALSGGGGLHGDVRHMVGWFGWACRSTVQAGRPT